ncbi:MAG TPA: hypothetical protein VFE62_04820 [Gemmataceae bacterium]|nr:hypothetical protein [Gemmataceae bacterium]
MWQQVSPNNQQLLQTAYEVLVLHDATWGSIQALKAWIQKPTASLFYFNGGTYELVVGYRFKLPEGEWRIEPGGVRGSFSSDAINAMVQQTVDFMRAQQTRTIFARSSPRGPSDPIQVMLSAAADGARQNSAIAEVTMQSVGGELRWGAVLR